MQTKTVQNNNNPVWNETLKTNYRYLHVLELSVWDTDILKGHDLIGRCQVCVFVCVCAVCV
jgi:Ca2+-dependent lipid-binding protein